MTIRLLAGHTRKQRVMPLSLTRDIINHALAEVLDEQEGDFDADTRFCTTWFRQHGFDEGDSGVADTLSRSTNTTLTALQRGGIFCVVVGKARLLGPDDLDGPWDPSADTWISDWEIAVRLATAASQEGTDAAARLMARAGQRRDLDTVKQLGYLLDNICQQKRWTEAGLLFNGLVTSWADIESGVRRTGAQDVSAATLTFDLEGEAGDVGPRPLGQWIHVKNS